MSQTLRRSGVVGGESCLAAGGELDLPSVHEVTGRDGHLRFSHGRRQQKTRKSAAGLYVVALDVEPPSPRHQPRLVRVAEV